MVSTQGVRKPEVNESKGTVRNRGVQIPTLNEPQGMVRNQDVAISKVNEQQNAHFLIRSVLCFKWQSF